MREIYIHIGTHKTGTTSIQNFLGTNREALKKGGLYVPLSGTIGPAAGHHNIAWELRNDQRFHPRFGTVSDLTAELRGVECQRVVLSSEDFEYLSQYPERLRFLDDELRELGYKRNYVVFLRNKRDYLFSLFCELRKHHGIDEDYQSLRKQVRTNGYVLVNNDWYFEFNYKRLRDTWTQCIGTNLACVNYDQHLAKNGLNRIFLSTLKVGEGLLQLGDHAPRLNESVIERDELCPCRSGLRFKYCHGNKVLKWISYAHL